MKPLIYLRKNGLMRPGVRYGAHFLFNKEELTPGMKLKSIHFYQSTNFLKKQYNLLICNMLI
jgi:hypothetical protein